MIASYKPGGTTDEEAPLPKLRLPTPPFASNGSPLGVIPSLIKLDKIKWSWSTLGPHMRIKHFRCGALLCLLPSSVMIAKAQQASQFHDRIAAISAGSDTAARRQT